MTNLNIGITKLNIIGLQKRRGIELLNKRRMKIIAFSALIILFSGIFVGCKSAKYNESTDVRVGYFPNITHSQALIGRATGEFQKELGDENKIDWKLFNAGSAEIEALAFG